jgi:vacuolar-type H+-ATPase subunit I/STV1
VIALAFAAAFSLPADAQKKIQCWTDKNGQRMCGDRVPQEYAGQKRDVIKDGRVIGTVSATKSQEEIAAEKREKEKAEAAQKQAEYDRALLESYRKPEDIIATRDERVALLDSRIQAAEKNASDTDKSLASLRARAEADQKNGKQPDEKLAKQVRQFEKAQRQNTKALERYNHERTTLLNKFDSDYARFRELRGMPPASPPPPKSATPAVAAKPATPANPATPGAGGATPATPATPASPATPPPKAPG